MHMVDINGDGMMDLVTGRRWWAHGRGDDGANDPRSSTGSKARRRTA